MPPKGSRACWGRIPPASGPPQTSIMPFTKLVPRGSTSARHHDLRRQDAPLPPELARCIALYGLDTRLGVGCITTNLEGAKLLVCTTRLRKLISIFGDKQQRSLLSLVDNWARGRNTSSTEALPLLDEDVELVQHQITLLRQEQERAQASWDQPPSVFGLASVPAVLKRMTVLSDSFPDASRDSSFGAWNETRARDDVWVQETLPRIMRKLEQPFDPGLHVGFGFQRTEQRMRTWAEIQTDAAGYDKQVEALEFLVSALPVCRPPVCLNLLPCTWKPC